MSSDQSVAIISAGGSGIGLSIAQSLHELGYQLFIVDIDPDHVAELQRVYGEGSAKVCDVSDPHQVDEAFTAFRAQHERLDLLVNNAGTFVEEWGTMPSALKVSELKETFETNFFGPFEMIREFVPLMLKSSSARIVNISSDMGSLAHINNPDSHVYEVMGPAYQSSKAAINALTVLFAKEFTGTHFKVNSASPGWCRTDMGTEDAPLSIVEGAQTPVMLATLPDDGPTGQFFSSTRTGAKMEW